MNAMTFQDSAKTYWRISKRAARKRYAIGEPFYIIACNMRPGMPFSMGMPVFPDEQHKKHCEQYMRDTETRDQSFNQLCLDFAWYNCSHESGYYPAFYVENPRV